MLLTGRPASTAVPPTAPATRPPVGESAHHLALPAPPLHGQGHRPEVVLDGAYGTWRQHPIGTPSCASPCSSIRATSRVPTAIRPPSAPPHPPLTLLLALSGALLPKEASPPRCAFHTRCLAHWLSTQKSASYSRPTDQSLFQMACSVSTNGIIKRLLKGNIGEYLNNF